MSVKELKHNHGGWVAYRPDIKILDCTVRDGGLINNHQFPDDFVQAVYRATLESGVDYIELGYKGAKRLYSPDKHGRWKHCDEDDIRRVIGEKSPSVKMAVMADAERTDYRTDLLPREKSVFDCVRVASYIHQIPAAIDMIKDAYDKGYEVLMQLMAISVVNEKDLVEALQIIAETPVSAVYIVDSYGALYSEQVRELTKLFIDIVGPSGKEVGFHGHNNQQLAFANTVEALIAGANRLDATLNGIGRGAGNCPLELLLQFLHNPKFRIRPVLECCRDWIVPLQKTIEWGYNIPYGLVGALNMHPGAAIEWRAGKTPDDYVAFYDSIIEEQS